MPQRYIALCFVLALASCATPTTLPNQNTAASTASDAALEPTYPSVSISFEAPPPLSSGNFHSVTQAPLNETLFPGAQSEDIFVVGMFEGEGLLHIYLSDGQKIFYAVSSDGIDWAMSPDPIYSGLIDDEYEHVPSSVGFIDAGYAIFLNTATIHHYQHEYFYSIWALVAPQPSGPWTLTEAPVVYGYPGPNAKGVYVGDPLVRPFLDGYRMYHRLSFSLDSIRTPDLGIAHSLDGLVWRYTSELPTEDMPDSLIMLTNSNEQDLTGLKILDVWPTETGWQMLYWAPDEESNEYRLFLEESEDGFDWQLSEFDVVLEELGIDRMVVSASVAYHQGSYFITYCSTEPDGKVYECYITSNR